MPEKLGARIAHYRSAIGWTQQALADRIAVSRTAISHFEMDLAIPSERTIVLLAGIFKCEPHELVDDTYYPAAKAARLPPVANRYTEVEKELAMLEGDLAWLRRLTDAATNSFHQATLTAWLDRLIALHASSEEPFERGLIESALQRVRREL